MRSRKGFWSPLNPQHQPAQGLEQSGAQGVLVEQRIGLDRSRFFLLSVPPAQDCLGLRTLLPAGPLPGIPSTIHTTFPLPVSSRLTHKSLTLDLPLPPPSHTYLRIFKELSSQGLVGLSCLPPPISSLTTSPSPLGSSHTGPLSSPSLGPSFTPLPPHQPPQGLYTDFPHLDRSSPESPRLTPSGLCSHITQVRPSLTAMSQPTPHALRVPAPWPVSFCHCRTSHHLR